MNEREQRVQARQSGEGHPVPVGKEPRGGPVPAWRQQNEPAPVQQSTR